MIQSLFLLSPTGEIIIERHFRGVVTERAVCDAYWNHTQRAPVNELPSDRQGTLYGISAQRDGSTFLAVCPAEVSPLTVLELLHRMASTFQDYFGNADEAAIKDNFSTVYQLIDEMVDYGWPLTTEGNALKAMIRPPTVMSKLLAGNGTVSDALPVGTVSNMPWRTAGVQYSNNEIYVDILEEVDAIVDFHGNIVSADVQGSVQCQSHLSGVPDLLLTFTDPALIDDCSFHPCVRYTRFENDGVVSFVPPDGNFELMKYRIDAQKVQNLVPPVSCHAQWTCDHRPDAHHAASTTTPTTGRLALQVGVTSLSSLVFSASAQRHKTVEDVSVTIPFPKHTKSTADFRVNMGTVLYDEATKVARWNVAANMDAAQKATLTCKFTLGSSTTKHTSSTGSSTTNRSTMDGGSIGGSSSSYDSGMMMSERRQRLCSRQRRRRQNNNSSWLTSPPNLSLGWKIPLASVSGISVSGLSVTGETYRPYKGVRNITKAGLFQVRCSS